MFIALSSLAALMMLSTLLVVGPAACQALQSQRARTNGAEAAVLAAALAGASTGPSSAALDADLSARLAAVFDQTDALWVVLYPADGSSALIRRHAPTPTRSPAWFVRLLPIEARAGQARIGVGRRDLGRLEFQAQSADAQDALWDLCLSTAAWLLVSVAAAAGVLTSGWLAWQRALRPLQAQTLALEQGRLIEIVPPEPATLQAMAGSLNKAVQRWRDVFAAQARQVALLQRQAQLDTVTGLPLRAGFISQLQQRLSGQGGPGAAVLLLHLPQLDLLNERQGREAIDRALAAVADPLLTYVERVNGAFAGRLNGSDFALCLPVSGVAHETAESLATALAAAPALRNAGATVLIAGVDGLLNTQVGVALAAADAALARTQADGQMVIDTLGELAAAAAGARAWREQIDAAVSEGRVQLAEFGVFDRHGALIHLECPLRVQLDPGGPYEPARRWLALARRSRLLPQVDLAAIDLALRACADDGQSRAVNAASASLATPDFIEQVTQRLAQSPLASALLAIECVQGPKPADTAALAEAAAAWRPFGVQLGVEHAGATPQHLTRLQNAGIDYVKIDGLHLRGLSRDPALLGYAQSLVALIHGLGLKALAEGIDDLRDLQALWPLDFDGATGPALAPGPRSVEQALEA
jgi:EAL domain-containing protein (putative c-di-GMP-specific phosphodiesterase class I)/GGDEF domain-containing protein